MTANQERLRTLTTGELSPGELVALRALLDLAFGDFADDDWQHALGGVHVMLDVGGEIRAHAAIVERELRVAGRPFRTGYVEAVATRPAQHGTGLGTRVMRPAADHIRDTYELGALSTGAPGFYARLGWQQWLGRSSVRTPLGEQRTPDDDGSLMVFATCALDLAAPISCDWRPGDPW